MTAEAEAEVTRLPDEVVVLIRQGHDNEAVERIKRIQAFIRETLN